MRKLIMLANGVAIAAFMAPLLPLHAQTQPATPSNASKQTSADKNNTPNATGSASVIVEGKPAMRAGDASDQGAVEIVPDVFIEGKPAVVCKNGTKSGNATVFIHGKPVARAGDCK